MRVLIDACVLYPTVLRQIVLGVAETGCFTPLWSERILEEWARAVIRTAPAHEALARGEIAAVRARWPEAMVAGSAATSARLWLPDANDIHVLAAAIDGRAEALMTLNVQDFPRRVVAGEGIRLVHPDTFLLEMLEADPSGVEKVVDAVHGAAAAAAAASGAPIARRALMKRARLPRLGKALEAGS